MSQYLHRPRWEEPLRLACAHLSDSDNEQKADRFVREILDAGSPYEDVCCRDLLLAARCLGDDVFVYHDASDRIFRGLDRALASGVAPLVEQVQDTMREMLGSRAAPRAIALLLGRQSKYHRVAPQLAASLSDAGPHGARPAPVATARRTPRGGVPRCRRDPQGDGRARASQRRRTPAPGGIETARNRRRRDGLPSDIPGAIPVAGSGRRVAGTSEDR